MLSTTYLLIKLANKYPEFSFKEDTVFCWTATDKSIHYNPKDEDFDVYLLHELSHALLNHADYDRDVQLIAMESEAWEYTAKIAKDYEVKITDDFIQSNLDSYRDWLHKRSICPKCDANGIQVKKTAYKCLACKQNWRVNEAKNCGLKRRSV